MFERIVPLQAPSLCAISTEDRGIQIQRMAQQRRPQALQRQPHQGLRHFGGPSIREPPEEPLDRIG